MVDERVDLKAVSKVVPTAVVKDFYWVVTTAALMVVEWADQSGLYLVCWLVGELDAGRAGLMAESMGTVKVGCLELSKAAWRVGKWAACWAVQTVE